MRIIVDVDGTVAQTVEQVVRWYNLDFNDNAKIEDIKDWDISMFLNPDAGTYIHSCFTNPTLYAQVEPHPQARDVIQRMREKGHQVYFATAILNGGHGIKFNWLVRNGFLTKDEINFYIEITDKFLLRGDVLIDDGFHNLVDFDGYRIMPVRAWNEKHFDDTRIIPCRNWDKIESELECLESQIWTDAMDNEIPF